MRSKNQIYATKYNHLTRSILGMRGILLRGMRELQLSELDDFDHVIDHLETLYYSLRKNYTENKKKYFEEDQNEI